MNSAKMDKNDDSILSIGNILAKSGQKIRQNILIDIGSSESPIPVQIPLTLINGNRPGSTLTLWAGAHGGEFVSIQALALLAEQISPAELKGRLIIVHVANPPASFNGRMNVSPLDGININRVFPGNTSGKPTERIAAWLFENTLPGANYFMDLHSGGIDETLRNFVAYPNCSGSPQLDAKARQLALSLGEEDLLIGKGGPKGGFSHAACARVYGIPSILVETGQLGQRDLASAQCLLFRLLRALRHLQMLDNSSTFPTPPSNCQITNEPREWIGSASLPANHTGLWYPQFETGDEIKLGQKLGELRDAANGKLLEEIVAPVEGRIFYAQNGLTVAKGTELVAIASAHNKKG